MLPTDTRFDTFADAYKDIVEKYSCEDYGEQLRSLCKTETEYTKLVMDLNGIQESANETVAELSRGTTTPLAETAQKSGLRVSGRATHRHLFGNVDRFGNRAYVSEPSSASDSDVDGRLSKRQRLTDDLNGEEEDADDEGILLDYKIPSIMYRQVV